MKGDDRNVLVHREMESRRQGIEELFRVGQQVTVIYDPANLARAVIMKFRQLSTAPILPDLMGLGFWIFTAVLTWLVFTTR